MPSLYNLALFVHVSSDVGIFIGIGLQLVSLSALKQVQNTDQARVFFRLIRLSESISTISALLTIASGLYLALTAWSLRTGWIAAALASLILLLAPLILGIIEPRMRTILKVAKEAPDGPLPEPLYRRIHDPLLGAGLNSMAALVLGLVFLMTTKPNFLVSILVMAFALALGLLSGLVLWRAPGPRRPGYSEISEVHSESDKINR